MTTSRRNLCAQRPRVNHGRMRVTSDGPDTQPQSDGAAFTANTRALICSAVLSNGRLEAPRRTQTQSASEANLILFHIYHFIVRNYSVVKLEQAHLSN